MSHVSQISGSGASTELSRLEAAVTQLGELHEGVIGELGRVRSQLSSLVLSSAKDPLLPLPSSETEADRQLNFRPTTAQCATILWDVFSQEMLEGFFNGIVVPSFATWNERLDKLNLRLRNTGSRLANERLRLQAARAGRSVHQARSVARDLLQQSDELHSKVSALNDAENILRNKAVADTNRATALRTSLNSSVQKIGLRVHQQRAMLEGAAAAQWSVEQQPRARSALRRADCASSGRVIGDVDCPRYPSRTTRDAAWRTTSSA